MSRLKRIKDAILGVDAIPAVDAPAPVVKTGEQTGLMAEPQGRRVYHEYFVGEDRGDGHHCWTTRVYTAAGLHTEKEGLALGDDVARKQADAWGLAKKAEILRGES